MRKHNHIHTLGALHYKVHFRFLSKLKDCAPYGPKNTLQKYRQRNTFPCMH